MSNITESLNKRAHVVHYHTGHGELVPTRAAIDDILKIGYPLATSKQNAFPYKCYVLGPNVERSNHLYQMCEQNKVDFDGDVGDKYHANPNLYHIATAPWTLIFTPRVAPPNAFAAEQCEATGTQSEMWREDFIPDGRESWGIEVGMIAKTITGAVCDAGWDTSYAICFPKQVEKWHSKHYPFIKYTPYLIQTIGKAELYKWQNMKPESLAKDTCPPFDDIFAFID